ncbi:hypothetical protein Tco_1220606 [Tanacetum coccineum]
MSLDVYGYEFDASEAAPQSPDPAPLSPAHASVYLEYVVPSDDNLEPAEAQPLPASVSLTVFSPDYSVDSEPMEEDLDEDPKEDLEEEPLIEGEEPLLWPPHMKP